MDGGRVVGTITLVLLLCVASLLGAPVSMVAAMAALAVAIAATMLLPGVGARALANLAERRYDRAAWELRWDRRGAVDDDRDARRADPGSGIPPELLPDEPEASRAWLRTLADIRGLPERGPASRRGERRRPGFRSR